MKIEQKAKAYDEALKKAKDMLSYKEVRREDMEYLFPELKESEDERIRENIIATIHLYYGEPLEDEAKEMIAWLEKQGEQKPNYCHHEVDLSNCSEEYTKGYYDGWNNCNQQHAQLEAEQKPADKVEPKFKVGDTIQPKDPVLGEPRIIERIYPTWGYDTNKGILDFEFEDNWELVEQKSAWSEEDKKMSRFIGNAITADGASEYLESKGIQVIDVHVWLDELKDRVQPKQDWSEDDKGMIEGIIDVFYNNTQSEDRGYIDYANYISWLKSIKDRVQPLRARK